MVVEPEIKVFVCVCDVTERIALSVTKRIVPIAVSQHFGEI